MVLCLQPGSFVLASMSTCNRLMPPSSSEKADAGVWLLKKTSVDSAIKA